MLKHGHSALYPLAKRRALPVWGTSRTTRLLLLLLLGWLGLLMMSLKTEEDGRASDEKKIESKEEQATDVYSSVSGMAHKILLTHSSHSFIHSLGGWVTYAYIYMLNW